MLDDLVRLGEALCRPAETPPVAAMAPSLVAGTLVALPAGGFGYRMRGTADEAGASTQKSLLPLPTGETLIGRVVRQYADAGFRRFVALVNHEGQAVEAYLRGGEPWGVELRCAHDPDPSGSGRTGALLHAIDTGVLPADRTVVVHNADCQVMRYDGCFPLDLLRVHASAGDAIATLAAVEGTPYPYTGMKVEGDRVTAVEMYPFIPVPTHTGITVLSPEALGSLREHFLRTKQNFERDMFPLWSAAGRLAAMVLSHRSWIAVDDRKAYRMFQQAVSEEPPWPAAA